MFSGGLDNKALTSILSYSPDTDSWQEVGEMKVARNLHAVAVVPDVNHHCS